MLKNEVVAGDLLLLDGRSLVLVLSTVPVDPFYDYGLDVFIQPLGYSEPFWIEKRRLFPLSCDLLHYYTPTLSP
jgi:hypothetical protein